MELTFKRPLESYTLPELEQMRWDVGALQKRISDRENEIRRECGNIVSLLDDLIREHEVSLKENGTPSLTVEEVRDRAALLTKTCEKFSYNWKRHFSAEERFFLTGEE